MAVAATHTAQRVGRKIARGTVSETEGQRGLLLRIHSDEGNPARILIPQSEGHDQYRAAVAGPPLSTVAIPTSTARAERAQNKAATSAGGIPTARLHGIGEAAHDDVEALHQA